MLLEEFENSPAVIEPTDDQIRGGGRVCDTIILAFSGELIDRLKHRPDVTEGGYLESINGKYPWYLYQDGERTVAFMLARLGAPVTVACLEELKAIGFKNFIILGSCGVLDKSLPADRIILPSSALRDEGTSYHYAPASDEISYDPALLLTMEKALGQARVSHERAKVWTTDAFYRETAAKVKRRLEAGAQVVDMEASAIMAWAHYRKAQVYQFFYTADFVDHGSHVWDKRSEDRTADVLVFWEIALTIAKELER